MTHEPLIKTLMGHKTAPGVNVEKNLRNKVMNVTSFILINAWGNSTQHPKALLPWGCNGGERPHLESGWSTQRFTLPSENPLIFSTLAAHGGLRGLWLLPCLSPLPYWPEILTPGARSEQASTGRGHSAHKPAPCSDVSHKLQGSQPAYAATWLITDSGFPTTLFAFGDFLEQCSELRKSTIFMISVLFWRTVRYMPY